jgi:hypothetical protein
MKKAIIEPEEITDMLDFLIQFLLTLVGIGIGGYILLAGRRYLWITLGIIGLSATANLLAVLATPYDTGWDLAENGEWLLVLISLGMALVGIYIGRNLKHIAVPVIGFAAGADIALWLFDIIHYTTSQIEQLPENTAIWLGILVIIIGGLVGLLLTRRSPDVAIILISMVIGTEIFIQALRLNRSTNFTAVISLSLALIGVVVQYASYLREERSETLPPGLDPPDLYPGG